MWMQELAAEVKYRNLFSLERLINMELLKRRILDEDKILSKELHKLRLKVKEYCEKHNADVTYIDIDDYVDNVLDYLQFGFDHGITFILDFSEQDELDSYVNTIEKIYNDFHINNETYLQWILSQPSLPKRQRLAEISYQNDLKAGYKWWLGAQGKIEEDFSKREINFDDEFWAQWNAIRSGATLLEMPLRIPRIRLDSGYDYKIIKADDSDKTQTEQRITLTLSIGEDVDGDRMLLELLSTLRKEWFMREMESIRNGRFFINTAKRGTLAFHSDEFIKKLEKKVLNKTIKEDQIEPFFLGILCWDENKKLGNLSRAIESVIEIINEFGHPNNKDNLHDRINKCYSRIRKKINNAILD
ncbi:hypothetical protein BUE93_18665 [Chromobacterium amazonense]|uniref:Uncharacterized protein n=2 Tax=Chromobacterium amazonense TaxID=1382803 RepID=A0A2S9X041_9NEIS|nr:hypothetical protein BUE93_18665 [Chromobacterium amazonense]